MSDLISGFKNGEAHMAEVGQDGLNVLSKSIPIATQIGLKYGQYYIVSESQSVTTGGTKFFYLKNNSSDKLLVVDKILIWETNSLPAEVSVDTNVTGTPGNTSSATIINKNQASSNVAEATAYIGDGITGLSDAGSWFTAYVDDTRQDLLGGSPVILATDDQLALTGGQNSSDFDFMVTFYFIDTSEL